ncbi:LuxR C-terminal-related transcriptional regulator [Streptomyces sp. SP17BM10]|uniref:response regulator transcription factor n=1 Tax=Streptomyces sp. SP17BM10 TaxID=3002530 RepID=UPI002E7A36ED|nr:LuxR C-terminal-related transcriptional regulator [Streptomyces sp. SP17BM10]MEE1788889.1 LuxR C-terminal-related transcriptional regulator [Streptomyces sp. SP17BM10]
MPEGHTCVSAACPCRVPPLTEGELDALSEREYEVFEHLGTGVTNTEIAHLLYITERTVKAHVGRVVRKLNVDTRTAAALAAQRHLLRNVRSDN